MNQMEGPRPEINVQFEFLIVTNCFNDFLGSSNFHYLSASFHFNLCSSGIANFRSSRLSKRGKIIFMKNIHACKLALYSNFVAGIGLHCQIILLGLALLEVHESQISHPFLFLMRLHDQKITAQTEPCINTNNSNQALDH